MSNEIPSGLHPTICFGQWERNAIRHHEQEPFGPAMLRVRIENGRITEDRREEIAPWLCQK